MRRGRRFQDVDLGRVFRLREAAALGLRLVPEVADPREFRPRPFACALRPKMCGACTVPCPFGQENDAR